MVPFDSVLVIAFGGPLGPDDVRPFLGNVLRGRRVTPERVEDVVHHYELFGGVSPLTALTRAQADGLGARLEGSGHALPVFVGMRNWHPFLKDTLAEMSRAGLRRAIGFTAAPHRSYSSCLQYRENVRDAQAAIRGEGLAHVDVTYVGDWYEHPQFIEAQSAQVLAAIEQLPAGSRAAAHLVFTAHSIPVSMAQRFPYAAQYEASASLVARTVREKSGLPLPHATTYQSRSGRPEDPWLGPDVCDYLREARTRGLDAVVICPIGFVSDHIEVLYDLDTEAKAVAGELGIAFTRARTVNDHPVFLDMMLDVVLETERRHHRSRPLPLAMPAA